MTESAGPPLRRYRILSAVLAVLVLLALTAWLHGDALRGGWRFDDGWILDFATRFSPTAYFFDPLITRGFSPSNVTPWNPLVYDLNLALFGLDPRPFYLHHLLLLASAAIATFALLAVRLPHGPALLGAALFLVGAPVVRVAQSLMVGHYLYGLVFCIGALYGFLRSQRAGGGPWAWFGVVCYALATSCKEVFVPLPLMLPLLGQGSWRMRIVRTLPYLAWAAVYALWRVAVLRTATGGYQRGGLDLGAVLAQFAEIPGWLFGRGAWAWVALVGLLALGLLAAATGRLRWAAIAGAAVLLCGPLVTLVAYPGLHGPNRYLLLPWWAMAVLVAYLVAQVRGGARWPAYLLAGLLCALALRQGMGYARAIGPELARFDAIYHEALTAAPGTLLVLDGGSARYWDVVLNGARRAQAALQPRPFSRIDLLSDRAQLDRVAVTDRSVRDYREDCRCVVDLVPRDPPTGGAVPLRAFEQLPYGPPYPPLFEPGGGRVESVSRQAAHVTIEGRLPMADDEPQQVLVLIAPGQPLRQRLVPRAVAGGADHAGFRLDLDYPDAGQAERAASNACLLSLSAYRGMALLTIDGDRRCEALLRAAGP